MNRTRVWHLALAACIAALVTGCASHRVAAPVAATPKYPALVQPSVPADLAVTPALRQQYDAEWRRLQSGDLRLASRGLQEILRQMPGFYPAETALGQIAALEGDAKAALAWFTSAVGKNDRYLPALEGRVEAALTVGDDLVTATALEDLLKVDPSREQARSRLGLIRLRIVQGQLAAAGRARSAGRLDEAQTIVERALQVSPSSPILYRELTQIEMARGALAPAEQHARKAVELDPADSESLAALGAVLEAEGKTAEAADVFSRAISIDPRPAWREKRDALRARARVEALPAEYRALPTAPSVTRAQVASAIGIDLEALVNRAPKKATVVVTDVRNSWAAEWILPVTQAGIMDIYPNHTFQPNAGVRRSDLAQIASQLLNIVSAGRPDQLARWRTGRPRLDDVPAGHLAYRAIGLCISAGVMSLDENGKFWPARPASGADGTAVIARIKQLAR
jgi:tetratricopeptide (TPR) repeat protein